jgi:hypothetical protein
MTIDQKEIKMASKKFEVIPWKFEGFPTYVCVYRGDGGMIIKSTLIDECRLTDIEFVEDSEFPGPVSKRNRDKAIQALHDAGYAVVPNGTSSACCGNLQPNEE